MDNYLQEVVVDIICNILNRYSYDVIHSDDFKPTAMLIRNALIRQYHEHPNNVESTWQDIESYKTHFQWSPRAFRAYSSALQNGMSESEIALSKNNILHFEHIVPNHLILKKIIMLKKPSNEHITPEQVKSMLDQSAIVILSKEEAEVLDGNPNKSYIVEGERRQGCGLRSKGDRNDRLASLGIDQLYSFNAFTTLSQVLD